MGKTTRFLILIPIFLALLACQFFYQVSLPEDTALRAVTDQGERQQSVTPPISLLPAIEYHTPTALHALTSTPSLTPAPTYTPTQHLTHHRVFDELWQIVADDYLYPDFNGVDWEAVRTQYKQEIENGLNDALFYEAMAEMVSILGDDHSIFLTPAEAKEEELEFSGQHDFIGIGIYTTDIPERQRIAIISVFPGSPADLAGLQPHESILAVNGQPIIDANGVRRELLRGPAGSQVELRVQMPGELPRDVIITRSRVFGPAPVPYTSLSTPDGRQVGYILLTTFSDETIQSQVSQALRDLPNHGTLAGIIIDNRQNSGGADTVTRDVLSHFTHGALGHFIDRDNNSRTFSTQGADIAGSQSIPLVILIGPNTASFGEIFAGILQDQGRAFLIGEQTDGNIELLWGYDFIDGSRAWIARETFRPLNHPDQNWEESGITPDLVIPNNWDQVTLQTDPAIHAAFEYFSSKD